MGFTPQCDGPVAHACIHLSVFERALSRFLLACVQFAWACGCVIIVVEAGGWTVSMW